MLWGNVRPAGSVVPIHVECLSGVMHACVGLYIPFWSSVFLFGALCANLGLWMHIQGLCVHIWSCAYLFGVVHTCLGLCPFGAVRAQLGSICACLELCMCVFCSGLYIPLRGCECLSRIVHVYMGL